MFSSKKTLPSAAAARIIPAYLQRHKVTPNTLTIAYTVVIITWGLYADSCIECARVSGAFNWLSANLLLDVQTNTNIADDLQMQFAHHRDRGTRCTESVWVCIRMRSIFGKYLWRVETTLNRKARARNISRMDFIGPKYRARNRSLNTVTKF